LETVQIQSKFAITWFLSTLLREGLNFVTDCLARVSRTKRALVFDSHVSQARFFSQGFGLIRFLPFEYPALARIAVSN